MDTQAGQSIKVSLHVLPLNAEIWGDFFCHDSDAKYSCFCESGHTLKYPQPSGTSTKSNEGHISPKVSGQKKANGN